MLLTQSFLTPCDPMDCRPLVSSLHGLLQTRILEWVAMPSFREVSQPSNRTPISSVQFSHSVVSNSLRSHELQHARPPCPSPSPGVHSDSRPLSQRCHLIISSSVISFSSCLHSFPASGSFQMSQFFISGGQSTGVSALASVLPMNTQD